MLALVSHLPNRKVNYYLTFVSMLLHADMLGLVED